MCNPDTFSQEIKTCFFLFNYSYYFTPPLCDDFTFLDECHFCDLLNRFAFEDNGFIFLIVRQELRKTLI